MLISELSKGSPDMTGETVLQVYAVISGKYAVYRTERRVMVQYADDDAMGVAQREALAPVEQLRGEIAALLDGWRNARVFNRINRQARADGFDRRTADGLIAGLRGMAPLALVILQGVSADIRAERLSIGRVFYLTMAVATLVAWAVVLHLTRGLGPPTLAQFMVDHQVVFAAGLGSWGALFSIVLAVHDRKIQTDMLLRDNLVDSALRISIGAISAVVLFALLQGHLINVNLGTTLLGVDDAGGPMALVIGFLAGFSERLVGDFLSTVAAPDPVVALGGDGKAVLLAAEAGSEDNPAGRAEAAVVTGPVVSDAAQGNGRVVGPQ